MKIPGGLTRLLASSKGIITLVGMLVIVLIRMPEGFTGEEVQEIT